MKQIRAYRTTLEEVLNAHPADSATSHFAVPTKATILAFNSGTLIQDSAGNYSIAVPGEWFRNGDNTLPQVDAFDQLNAVGLTVLKEDILKKIMTPKGASSGQENGTESSSSDEQTSPAVASDSKRQKKSKDRTGAV